ncbi:hypothetical protein RJT34_11684 [Clitoria ternatea]|uniref:Uncharacterized protein n=1 Tax=Clitoria ternatea TaxID=43366 RepID=A0AAN9JKZ0_CLITE
MLRKAFPMEMKVILTLAHVKERSRATRYFHDYFDDADDSDRIESRRLKHKAACDILALLRPRNDRQCMGTDKERLLAGF